MKYRYIVQMADGRELDLQGDGSVAGALAAADERLADVLGWYVIGPGMGLADNMGSTETKCAR